MNLVFRESVNKMKSSKTFLLIQLNSYDFIPTLQSEKQAIIECY